MTDVRQEWLEQFSVADQLRLDALDDDTRAAVERYIRSEIEEWIAGHAPYEDECDEEDE